MGQEHSSEPVPADYQGSGLMRWLTKTGLGARATSSMTFTSKIFFVCKDFSWRLCGDPGSLGCHRRELGNSTGGREDSVFRSRPLSVSVPLDSLESLGSGLPFPWVSSSGGDHANRVLQLCRVRQWWVMHSLGVSKRKGLRALRLLLICRPLPGVLCPEFSGSRADRSLPS